MSTSALVFLSGATACFLLAAAGLRLYVQLDRMALLVCALVLYTAGNLMMVRLMREGGMAVAISVSAVLQLVLANAVAIGLFAERPGTSQLVGIVLGIVAVALILWPARGQG